VTPLCACQFVHVAIERLVAADARLLQSSLENSPPCNTLVCELVVNFT
jgi:hypothetical protein